MSGSTYFSLPLAEKSGSSVFRKQQKLDPFEKHKQLLQHYKTHYSAKDIKNTTIKDILVKSNKFLRDEDEEEDATWDERVAKKYYDKLFKEYCNSIIMLGIANLSQYKSGRVAMRWRTKQEVIDGTGQFTCASMKCEKDRSEPLKSWEVNFGYIEDNLKKNALVKLRLCAECSAKLNYKKNKERQKEAKRKNEVDKNVESDKRMKILDNETNEEKDNGDILKDKETIHDGDKICQQELSRNHWIKPIQLNDEIGKTKEQEMDDFLADLFQ